jgi:hypothetical protein
MYLVPYVNSSWSVWGIVGPAACEQYPQEVSLFILGRYILFRSVRMYLVGNFPEQGNIDHTGIWDQSGNNLLWETLDIAHDILSIWVNVPR